MSNPAPLRFASPELAKKIADIHGEEVIKITVKMIGKKDVRDYLKKVKEARAMRPSSTFRCK